MVVPAAPAAAAVGGWSALGWYLIRAALDLAVGAPPRGGVVPAAEPVHELAVGGEEEEAEALFASGCPPCPACPEAALGPAPEPEPTWSVPPVCPATLADPACWSAIVQAGDACFEQAHEHDAVLWAVGSASFGLFAQAAAVRVCRRRAPVRRAPRQAIGSGSG